MAKIRKQIISPHVRFAASSRGPYANKLGGGMYAKSFNLGCFEYYFVSGDRIELPVTLGGTSPGRIEVTARPDSLDTSTNRLIIEGDGGTAQNSFRIWWFATPTGRYMFRAFSGDNIVNPYVEQSINNPQELKFVGRWKAASGGGQFDITDQDNVTYTQTGVSGTSSPIPHNKIIVGINRSLQANSQWVGVIRDIKLYDAEFNGNLVHWWKVDDNATGTGAIKDSVGDADGDLIQGSGAWRACTSWQRPADDADFKAFGETSAGVIKALVRGQGAVTFERQTTATVETGPDGLIEECLEHEIRHRKGRRVENLLNLNSDVISEDLTAEWLTAGGASITSATTWTTSTTSNQIYLSNLSSVNWADGDYVVRAEVSVSADCDIEVLIGNRGLPAVTVLASQGTRVIAWSGNIISASNGNLNFRCDDPGITITMSRIQLQNKTGQSDSAVPDEYVSVGVGADHGAFVDGVRYYAKTNPCQVDGNNVVTEDAATTPITDYYTLFEPASTNYTDDSNDLSGGAETVDLTAGGTGDFTLSVSGTAAVTVAAGTATGTGFGQATAGNPVTFNLTSTGTVTLTLDSGSLDTAQGGQAVKQVEPGSTATSFIITDGSPPVTRTADDGGGMFEQAANFNQDGGTWFVDFWTSAIPTAGNVRIVTFTSPSFGFMYHSAGGSARTHDGSSSVGAGNIITAIDNRYRWAVDFGTDDNTKKSGLKDVDGAGSWGSFGSNAYDGNYPVIDDNINICGLPPYPIGIRSLTGYKKRKGRDWVEENL